MTLKECDQETRGDEAIWAEEPAQERMSEMRMGHLWKWLGSVPGGRGMAKGSVSSLEPDRPRFKSHGLLLKDL